MTDWLTRVGRGITAALDDALSPDKGKGAPGSKRAKGEKGAAIETAEASGLSPDQSTWIASTLNRSIAASQTSFASAVHERFVSVEENVQQTEEEVKDHRVQIDDLKNKMNEVAQQLEEMKGENVRLTQASSQASTQMAVLSQRLPDGIDTQLLQEGLRAMEDKINKKLAEQTSATTATSSVPYEARTSVRIGGLGWNTPKEELEARAKRLLTELGIVIGTDISDPVAPMRGGSCCDAVVTEARSVQVAKLACQSKGISYHMNGEKKFSRELMRRKRAKNSDQHV